MEDANTKGSAAKKTWKMKPAAAKAAALRFARAADAVGGGFAASNERARKERVRKSKDREYDRRRSADESRTRMSLRVSAESKSAFELLARKSRLTQADLFEAILDALKRFDSQMQGRALLECAKMAANGNRKMEFHLNSLSTKFKHLAEDIQKAGPQRREPECETLKDAGMERGETADRESAA